MYIIYWLHFCWWVFSYAFMHGQNIWHVIILFVICNVYIHVYWLIQDVLNWGKFNFRFQLCVIMFCYVLFWKYSKHLVNWKHGRISNFSILMHFFCNSWADKIRVWSEFSSCRWPTMYNVLVYKTNFCSLIFMNPLIVIIIEM